MYLLLIKSATSNKALAFSAPAVLSLWNCQVLDGIEFLKLKHLASRLDTTTEKKANFKKPKYIFGVPMSPEMV